MSFRNFLPAFDPRLVVCRIIATQTLLYIALGAWLLLLNGLRGRPATAIGLELVFSCEALLLTHPSGSVVFTACFFNALAGGCSLCIVVERAKHCLDFAATFYFVHLCCCLVYDGLPENWEWWVATGIDITAMSLLGEYLCMRCEMRDISFFRR